MQEGVDKSATGAGIQSRITAKLASSVGNSAVGRGVLAKFVRHLVGFDEATDKQARAEKAKRWTPSLQGLKLSDAFHGIHFTTNFLFFLLFVGLFLWLFVIYWVRHHEPFANQVLGTPNTSSRTYSADRALVNGIKRTLPVRTSAHTGDFYVPSTTPEAAAPTSPVFNSPFASSSRVGGYSEQMAKSGGQNYIPHPAYGVSRHFQTGTVLPPVTGNYMVGVQTTSGTKVKTIVNR